MLLRTSLLTLLTVLNIDTANAVDYEKVQQELHVMADIMKRSITRNEGCRGCSVNIRNHYLANQGAVFYMVIPGILQHTNFSGPGGVFKAIRATSPLQTMNEIDVDVNQILIGTAKDLDEHETSWSWSSPDFINDIFYNESDVDKQEELIDLRRERQKLKRKIAGLKRKAAHANSEQDESKFGSEIEDLKDKLEKIDKKYVTAMKERKTNMKLNQARVQAKKEAMNKKRREQSELIKRLVMTSLCEYQTTLRNLPENEHVSLVFEGMPDREHTKVYVFDKSKLAKCESDSSKISALALEYMI